MRSKTEYISLLAFFAFAIALFCWKGEKELGDYCNYYGAGELQSKDLLDADIYDVIVFNERLESSSSISCFGNYQPNTPVIALFMQPFLKWEAQSSKFWFVLLGLLLFLYASYVVCKEFSINYFYLILVAPVFLVPLINNIKLGQLYFFLFFFIFQGLVFYQRGYKAAGAFFWSVAILLKIFPVILIFFLCFKRAWLTLTYLISFSGLLLLACISLQSIDLWAYFFLEVVPRAMDGQSHHPFTVSAQTAFMFIKNMTVYDAMFNREPLFDSPLLFYVLKTIVQIGFFGLAAIHTSRNSSENLCVLCFWLIAALLVTPLGSTYSLIFWMPLFLVLFQRRGLNALTLIPLILVGLAANIPLKYLPEGLPFLKLLLLVISFFIVTVDDQSKVKWRHALIFIPVFICLNTFSFFNFESYSQGIPLNSENELIVSSLREENGYLVYELYDWSGRREVITNEYTGELECQWLIERLEKPRKVCTSSNGYDYYLSDQARGIGFNGIFKIRHSE